MSTTIQKIIDLGPKSYSTSYIPKSSGGKRKICAPSEDLKQIQKTFVYHFNLNISPFAVAYRFDKSMPPKSYLLNHLKYNFTVSLDLSSFFSSIKLKDVINCLTRHKLNLTEKQIDLSLKIILKEGEKGIPMGSCCSPWLSNAIMYEFDNSLEKKLSAFSTDYFWCRYSDNIDISCNSLEEAVKIKSIAQKHIHNCKSPQLRVNFKKTELNKLRGTRKILGIYLTPDKRLTIGLKRKKIIDNLLYKDNKYNSLSSKDIKTLQGYLSYAKYYDSNFWAKLVSKYGTKRLLEIQSSSSIKSTKKRKGKKHKKLDCKLIKVFLEKVFPHKHPPP